MPTLFSTLKDSSHGEAVEPTTNVPSRLSNDASSADRNRSQGKRCKTRTHASDEAGGSFNDDSVIESVSSSSATANRMISDLSLRCASIPAATADACRLAAEMSISESSTESGAVSFARSAADDDGSEKRKSIMSSCSSSFRDERALSCDPCN